MTGDHSFSEMTGERIQNFGTRKRACLKRRFWPSISPSPTSERRLAHYLPLKRPYLYPPPPLTTHKKEVD
jgi:hypothetical protein